MAMTVSFEMTSGDKDNNLERIVKMFDGKTGDRGVCLVGPYADWRDVECKIPDDKLDACSAVLRKAGFKVDEAEEFDSRDAIHSRAKIPQAHDLANVVETSNNQTDLIQPFRVCAA